MWKRIGSALMAEGQNIGQDTWNDFSVFGDVARGKAKIEDPETQSRVMGAASFFGASEAPEEVGVREAADYLKDKATDVAKDKASEPINDQFSKLGWTISR